MINLMRFSLHTSHYAQSPWVLPFSHLWRIIQPHRQWNPIYIPHTLLDTNLHNTPALWLFAWVKSHLCTRHLTCFLINSLIFLNLSDMLHTIFSVPKGQFSVKCRCTVTILDKSDLTGWWGSIFRGLFEHSMINISTATRNTIRYLNFKLSIITF